MILIHSQGKSFLQGSAGELASANEKPQFENRFTYDFQMDISEVTQASFHAIMGRDPVPANSMFGLGDTYPVYNVSWFDAALFCNARSKQFGLDTVYEYSRIEQVLGGGVTNLVGLSIHLDRIGIRLPTEAEWEFAANSGAHTDFPWGGLQDSALAKDFSWFGGNAEGATHPVAGLKANAYGLYDMTGNVMEWVNDWKGSYPLSGTEDFTGSRDPSIQYDVPVKGGAFKYGIRELRPANRTATYSTIRSATAEYVGFRCAIGPISHPIFSTADGHLALTDATKLDITRIQNYVAARPAKLVFVNANQNVRHLVYVDFQMNPPRVQEFGDFEKVYYPTISPDGNWVAFGTAIEGSSTGSDIYIRRLADSISIGRKIGPGFIPRWWVDPASRDTFLVYTNSALDNTQPQWNTSQTLYQKIQSGEPVGEPQLLTAGGYHDGQSQDGKWLATGYRRLKIKNNVTGESRILFTAPLNGKAPGDTSQVCNVSIAPDSSGRTLFLDFGFEGKSTVTGSFYAVHQIAFISDTVGQVVRHYKAPREEASWDDMEWSNQVGYAVSSTKNEANDHRHLYLLNLQDGQTTRLVSGTELLTPGLWLGEAPETVPSDGLDLDSLAHYNDPVNGQDEEIYASRMVQFWKMHKNLELIFTGSSHAMNGINPHLITKYNAFNIGYEGNGWLGQEEWVKTYAVNHCPNLKVMVMEVFPGLLVLPGADQSWRIKILKTKGMQYDASHAYWIQGLPLGFEELVHRAPNPTWPGIDSMGYFLVEKGNWGGEPVLDWQPDWGIDNPEYLKNIKMIEAMAKYLSDLKIHLVLVNYPTNPAFKKTIYYGPYGPKTDVAVDLIKKLKDMEKVSPYVHFYDAHNFNNHDYTDAEALDKSHLNSFGAAKLTRRIDSLVNGF